MKKYQTIVWGVVFLLVGILLGLNALNVIDVSFDGWWTLFIIIPCFIDLFKKGDKTGNLLGISIGVILLLCAQGVFEYKIIWKLLLPVIFVIIGGSIIVNSIFGVKISDKIKSLNKSSNATLTSIFASSEINNDDKEFNGKNIVTVFGGTSYDLRKAIINEDCLINAYCVFGGLDLIVPKNVKVVVKPTSIFGDVSEENNDEAVNDDAKVLYVNAICAFGGIDIKYTIKER